MKRNKLKDIVIRIQILLIFALMPPFLTSFTLSEYDEKNIPTGKVYPSVFNLSDNDKIWIEETIDKMSIREKCAQMIMPWIMGKEMKPDDYQRQERIENLVNDLEVGGFIFFQGDVVNEYKLISKLQRTTNIPFLMSSDFERGLGYRLENGTDFPYNMALAATGDTRLAYDMAKVIALESKALGVHQNYAPVADINNNPQNPIINIRSFSEDKTIVSQFTSAFIEGANSERYISTVKHFPGHGDTEVDSHTDLPLITVDRMNLVKNELVPFIHAIESGVQSIMVGHLIVPAIDPTRTPATLSKKIVTDFLIGELGFDGLIVTDAMNMAAITKYYSVAESTVLAVKAGNDIILFPPEEEIALNAIVEAVQNGEISEERIDRSVRKILAAKSWVNAAYVKAENLNELDKITTNLSHKRLSHYIAERSITMVKNDNDIIPIDPEDYKNVTCITITNGNGSETDEIFANLAAEEFENFTSFFINRRSRAREYFRALQLARSAELILIPSFIKIREKSGAVQLQKQQEDLIKNLLKLDVPVVLLSLGNPYLLAAFEDSMAYLTSYGGIEVSQDAMFNAILGETDITGKLPVSIPDTDFETGYGLELRETKLKFINNASDTNYNFTDVNKIMKQGVDNKVFPGGVLLAAQYNKVIYHKAFGSFTYDPITTEMKTDAIFDLSSLTGPLVTTTAAMILYEEDKIDLDNNVTDYLPEFGENMKQTITIKNLLLHNSGLPSYINFEYEMTDNSKVEEVISKIYPVYPAGSRTVYSDLNLITLQLIIEKITGKPIEQFIKEKIFDRLNLQNTMFNPPVEKRNLIPPTSKSIIKHKADKGVVHDLNAYLMGGAAGHAGLFSSADELAIIAQMILNNGKYNDKRFLKAETIIEWTDKFIAGERAFGWNILGEDNFEGFSDKNFGQKGFTGTSIWFDKEKDFFVILLTNSIYPDGNNDQFNSFWFKLHNTMMEAVNYY